MYFSFTSVTTSDELDQFGNYPCECVCNTRENNADVYWSGSGCRACDPQCQNGGVGNGDCTACVCPTYGYTGKFCEEEIVTVELQLLLDDALDREGLLRPEFVDQLVKKNIYIYIYIIHKQLI